MPFSDVKILSTTDATHWLLTPCICTELTLPSHIKLFRPWQPMQKAVQHLALIHVSKLCGI